MAVLHLRGPIGKRDPLRNQVRFFVSSFSLLLTDDFETIFLSEIIFEFLKINDEVSLGLGVKLR